MIDKAKRNTLKTLTAAVAGAVPASQLIAHGVNQSDSAQLHSNGGRALAQISVTTRVSAIHNDVELVLTNTGPEVTTITHMTPSVARVARGEFNFGELMKKGPVVLDVNRSVSVPITRKTVKLWSAASNGTATPLAANLRRTMSVVTDNSAFAEVNIADYVSIA